MLDIAIILGSTRPNRRGEQVAAWVHETAALRSDATYELLDLRDQPLPLLDEPVPAAWGQYHHAHTQAWASKVGEFDGFVFVTPEYNHGLSAALKNAIDFVYAEWGNKAAGLVSYGGLGNGTGAAAQLRQICGQLGMADVPRQVPISLATDFEGFATFNPGEHLDAALSDLLDQVNAWAAALEPLRR